MLVKRTHVRRIREKYGGHKEKENMKIGLFIVRIIIL